MRHSVEALEEQVHEIFGAPLGSLSAAQIQTSIPKLEALVTEAEKAASAGERKIRAEAANALGGKAGMQKLSALREDLAPLQARRDLLRLALETTRDALEATQRREWEHAVGSARESLERELDKRYKVGEEMQRLIHALAAKLVEFNRLGESAIHEARSKLSGSHAIGLRLSATTGQGFRPETAQHEINMSLAWISGRAWVYREMPHSRALPSFSELTNNWHSQLISDFEERYRHMQPAPAASSSDEAS